MSEKRYFEVQCGDWQGHQINADSHEKAVKKMLSGKNPKTWSPLARVREDHPRKSRRKWMYVDPNFVMK